MGRVVGEQGEADEVEEVDQVTRFGMQVVVIRIGRMREDG
jgi:hypothetical protein